MGKKLSMVFSVIVILSVSGCGYNTMQTNEEAVKEPFKAEAVAEKAPKVKF